MAEIGDYLIQQNIDGLYHFTEVRNLRHIFEENALLSLKELTDRKIPTRTGGDTTSIRIAKSKGLTDYISLSFTPYSPMSSDRKLSRHLCFLVFRHDVADLPGVLFCNGNANANSTKHLPGLAGAMNVNLLPIKNGVTPGNGNWHDAARSEILIPKRLDLGHLQKILFVNGLSLQVGRELTHKPELFNFEIDSAVFFSDPSVDRDISINTLLSVEFENCQLIGDTYVVDRSKTSDIILKIKVRVIKRMNLTVLTVCSDFEKNWTGAYVGIMDIEEKYAVSDFIKDEYIFNIKLDGSFWYRKVVMVN